MWSAFTEKDGKKYLHVTSATGIIRMPFLEKWRGNLGNEACDRILQESITRGNDFHKYCEMIDKGQGDEIDLEKLKGLMKQMVDGYRVWFFENVEKVIQVEKTMFSEKHLYCGKPDLVCVLKGRKTPDLIDRKSGKHLGRKEELQLSAYKEMLKDNGVNVKNRIILHCRETLKEKTLDQAEHDSDFRYFLYAKELYIGVNK